MALLISPKCSYFNSVYILGKRTCILFIDIYGIYALWYMLGTFFAYACIDMKSTRVLYT